METFVQEIRCFACIFTCLLCIILLWSPGLSLSGTHTHTANPNLYNFFSSSLCHLFSPMPNPFKSIANFVSIEIIIDESNFFLSNYAPLLERNEYASGRISINFLIRRKTKKKTNTDKRVNFLLWEKSRRANILKLFSHFRCIE